MTTTLFGIKNCDSVKKARKWLDNHQVDYTFHDFKTQGLPSQLMKEWLSQLSLDDLINKRGTTWRQLNDEQKQQLTTDKTFSLITEHPTLIKRPVLNVNGQLSVGFKSDHYDNLF